MAEIEIIARQRTRITIGEEKIWLYKLTLGNIADLDRYLQDDYEQKTLEKARRVYDGEIPDVVREGIMEGLSDEKLEELRGSTEGARYMLWCALKAEYPSITLEQAAHVIPVDDIEKAVDAISPKEKKRDRTKVKKKAKK